MTPGSIRVSPLRPVRDRPPRAFVLPLRRGDHGIDARAQPASIIALLEIRRHLVIEDAVASDVRQRALKAVAGLDAHLVILHENEEDRAVVHILLSHAPRLEDSVAVVVQPVGRLHFRINRHHDLVRGLPLEVRELRVESLRRLLIDDVRVIVEILRRLRRHVVRPQPPQASKCMSPLQEPEVLSHRLTQISADFFCRSLKSASICVNLRFKSPAPYCEGAGLAPPKLKFTAGGFSAPVAASKYGFGWKPAAPA